MKAAQESVRAQASTAGGGPGQELGGRRQRQHQAQVEGNGPDSHLDCRGRLCMYRFLCGVRRCSIYMFRFSGSFIILIGLRSSVPPTSSICTLFRCPSFSWWCRDPGPCARWVCVVRSFGLVGGHPPCGPHGFWFTPFVHFCTRDPVRHWSALHTCQPSDPMFKSYRIRFSPICQFG